MRARSENTGKCNTGQYKGLVFVGIYYLRKLVFFAVFTNFRKLRKFLIFVKFAGLVIIADVEMRWERARAGKKNF